MKAAEEEDWYFIPDSVSVGTFPAGRTISGAELADRLVSRPSVQDFGFVTCRFKYGQWVSPSVFSRLTKGYKPSNQRDRAAQLEKTVTGAVTEMENGPVPGFRLVAWGANPYGFCTRDYERSGDVVLQDPRGFCVALSQDSFFRTLSMCGCNVASGELSGKFCYGWNARDKSMVLVPESCAGYPGWKARSGEFRSKEKAGYTVPKRDLVPGKVYRAAKVLDGDWMYVGVFDTYSQNCHLDAFDHGGVYDVERFREQEAGWLRQKWRASWPTAKGKLVFFSMSPRLQQYAMRSDADGIFSREVEPAADGTYRDANGEQYRMYGDSAPVTFERVLEDVSRNPGFNRIVFSPSPRYEPTPLYALEFDFGAGRDSPRVFPFVTRFDACLLRSADGRWHKATYYSSSRRDAVREYKIYSDVSEKSQAFYARSMLFPSLANPGRAGYYTKRMTVLGLKNEFSPTYPVYAFENGKELRPEHAVVFVPGGIRKAAEKLY